MRLVLALLIAGCVAAGCGSPEGSEAGSAGAPAGTPATIALDFQPNAVHAAIFAAVEAGEPLEVRAPSASTDSLKTLLAGRADVAVVDIHDFGLARERGKDVVAVGALVQAPLAAVIAQPEVRRPRDLEGRRVGVTGLPSDDAVLSAVVESDGGDPSRVRRTTIGFSAVPSLAAGKVDAVTAFWNVEGVALRRRAVRTREFRVADFGAPRYPELVLVVERSTRDERPDLVQGVLEALRAGAQAALADPAPALRRIARASGARDELVRAQFDELRPLLDPGLGLDRTAIQAWSRFDARFGVLDAPIDVDEAFELGAGGG